MNEGRKTLLKSYFFALLGVLIALSVDIFTKVWVINNLRYQPPRIVIYNVFQLRYLENRGAAFGILYGQQYFLIIVTFLVLGFMIWLYHKIPAGRRYYPLRFCAILLLAGAIGNLLDRLRWGFVVDFLFLEIINFPIFNVADMYVVISCILFAILVLFFYKDHELEVFKFKREKSEE